jgi:hypothetical protein
MRLTKIGMFGCGIARAVTREPLGQEQNVDRDVHRWFSHRQRLMVNSMASFGHFFLEAFQPRCPYLSNNALKLTCTLDVHVSFDCCRNARSDCHWSDRWALNRHAGGVVVLNGADLVRWAINGRQKNKRPKPLHSPLSRYYSSSYFFVVVLSARAAKCSPPPVMGKLLYAG